MAFNAFGFAWKHAYKIPGPILRGLLNVAADVTWLLHNGGVHQLEKNLQRVRPDLTPKQVRALSRPAMRSYLRYFGEAFVLTHASEEQVRHRVRAVNDGPVIAAIAAGKSPVRARSHQGNWDLAGVWASAHLNPVLTVAERLKPEEVFQDFVTFREALGMTILAAGDSGVFRELLRAANGPGRLICLLADRDLSASGIEVDLFGRRARVAAGPAALAVGSKTPLIPASIHYERLTGERRRHAGSPWGIVITFHPEVEVDRTLPKTDQVAAATQGWIDALAQTIHAHPQDWHMLQKVFIEDLDPERYARTLAKESHG
jgi:KDO2-lipid IV(A) lauroyltransferase